MRQEHIICVDDEEGILVALRQQLMPFEQECDIDLAQSGQEALDLIDELTKDDEQVVMVIADQIMPGMTGVELLEKIYEQHPDTINILLTGQAGLDAVVRAINNAGLHRYISKPWDEADLQLTVGTLLSKYRLRRENVRLLKDLKNTNAELKKLNVELEVRVEQRTRELEEANQRLSTLAITDGLTGTYNHRHFHERLNMEVERSGRTNLPLALLMIDVDKFKNYNDRFGHPAGDEVLRRVAGLLSEGRRVNDVVTRYGGEEFAILLIDTPRKAAKAVAEQMRKQIAAEKFIAQPGGEVAHVTISIGVAVCPDEAKTPNELLMRADSALYRAKRKGRNRVEAMDDGGD
ncbi:MAG: diguanylate cyclase [Pseudomonadota bacterium]